MTKARKQKKGSQRQWKLEELEEGLRLFYEKYKHYPTSQEIDAFEFLPSSRSIQRRFGGVIELRRILKLGGQADYTKGKHSSNRAKKINERAHKIEKQVHNYLVNLFGVEFVHREYFFTDDKRTRTDFFVYHKKGGFSVDVFYPDSRHNLIGCLNGKLKKYTDDLLLQYPVIFLQMNENITSFEIEDIIKNKKNNLRKYQHLMCFEEFKRFCELKDPRL